MNAAPADLGRRTLLAAADAALLAPLANARAQARDRVEAVRKLIGDARPQTSGLVLDLPMLSEDGSSVPLTVTLRNDVPLSDASFIRSLHLFAARNPSPEIASFELAPAMGRVQISTRVRLNETQHVIAVARLSQGAVLVAEREVRITTSGCLARSGGAEGPEMQVRVRLPPKAPPGVPVEVVTLITHPMETGLATDAGGKTPPERIIRSFEASFAGSPLLRATLHRSMAANPYLRFAFTPKAAGRLELRWTEDGGRSAQYAGEIALA
jgi:sulfur-oxidizing protein SoxY